jgi:integrase
MPAATEIERRNRALVAFILLTGARDSAVASAKLKHIDIVSGCFYQDAREVKTKYSKTFTTAFFPVGEDIRQIVADWVSCLRREKLWGHDDPLFPKTLTTIGTARQFEHVHHSVRLCLGVEFDFMHRRFCRVGDCSCLLTLTPISRHGGSNA